MINRREMIKTTGLAGASMFVGAAFTAPQCSKPKLVVTIITGAVAELKTLFPNLEVLDKISSVAVSLKTAWDAGKFDDARTFFTNLDTLVGQVISDLGVNATARVKLILATLGIGLRVVAALFQEQAVAQPAVAAAARARAGATADRVMALANAATADALLKASRP